MKPSFCALYGVGEPVAANCACSGRLRWNSKGATNWCHKWSFSGGTTQGETPHKQYVTQSSQHSAISCLLSSYKTTVRFKVGVTKENTTLCPNTPLLSLFGPPTTQSYWAGIAQSV